ncbi:hypothetical protein ACFFQF_27850 [Haladaptatus pallidirubidus]
MADDWESEQEVNGEIIALHSPEMASNERNKTFPLNERFFTPTDPTPLINAGTIAVVRLDSDLPTTAISFVSRGNCSTILSMDE